MEDNKEKNKAILKAESLMEGSNKNCDGNCNINGKVSGNFNGGTCEDNKNKVESCDEELILRRMIENERAENRVNNALNKKAALEENKKEKELKKKNRQIEKDGLKQLKIMKKEERLKRRDLIKHETVAQRAERKYREEKQRKDYLAKKEKELALIKAERKREKELMKMEREKMKQNNKKEKRQRGLGGWIVAVCSLSVISLVLGTMLIWNMYMPGNSTAMMSSGYSKNFYDLVDYVDNMDVNLSKLILSEGKENRQRVLGDIIVQANLAEENLASLPIKEQSRASTIKFVNQVSDFGKYLRNKMIDGEPLSERDISTLHQVKKISKKLKDKLDELVEKMGDNFNFATLISGEENNIVMETFSEIEYNSVEYPKMIYDGPFADKENNLAGNKKHGKIIKEDEAIKIVKNKFSHFGIIECMGKGIAKGESFNVFNIEAKTKKGDLFVQVSEQGEVVMFNCYYCAQKGKFDRDSCIQNATKFLNKLGYSTVKPVWTCENDNSYYINFAHFQDDVVVYSDLIKVNVCTSDGLVYDMDAKMYAENHKERKIPQVKIRVEDAEKKVCCNLDVQSSRLALIPLENGSEKLAYEFFGEGEDGEYYVYIDAVTGRELKIFKVIESGKGTLLL